MISVSATALAGVRFAGFHTTALPKASAGAIFQAGVATGKFHGLTMATTPTGSRRTSISIPGRTLSARSPCRAQRLGREVGEELARAVDLAAALGQRLALLARQQTSDLVGARHQLSADRHQHVVPLLHARGPPQRLGPPGRAERRIEMRCVRLRVVPDQVESVGRITVLDPGGAVAPLTVDVDAGLFGHDRPPFSSGASRRAEMLQSFWKI